MHSEVQTYFDNLSKWQSELRALRGIVTSCGLEETYKWRNPCYVHHGANIVIISGLKEYCFISFFKGALLSDPYKILFQQTENSQSGRIIKFTSVQDILDIENLLKEYVFEAIEIERAGLKVEYKKAEEYEYPVELLDRFEKFPLFKSAFEALTPGRQKGYLLHFSGSKQSKTREQRIERYAQRIMNGKGITDCVCGLSKKMPSCDGSHKHV